MMPGKKKETFLCKCNKNVTKTNSSVGCYICGSYFHIKCVNVTDEQHKLFCQNRNVFHYICETCNEAPKNKYSSNLSLTADDIQQELHNISMDIGVQFEEHNRIFEKQVYSSIAALEQKMIELFDKFRMEQQEKMERLINEKFMGATINQETDSVHKRLDELETNNSVLQRRLNRTDIIIKGLPKNIKNLRVPIYKIASLCGSPIQHGGLQHCAYIHNGRSVLVKLNSVQQRDLIMMRFSKKRFLVLKDVIGGDLTSKVFLTDHLTPAAAKLLSLCRDLFTEHKILRYKYINTDVPKVRVLLPDNKQAVLTTEQCITMLDEDLFVGDISSEQNARMINAEIGNNELPSMNFNKSFNTGFSTS